jgi:hypothetical protein
MANTRAYNVIKVDTNDTTLTGPLKICGINVLGTNPVVTIKKNTSSGSEIFAAQAVGFYDAEILAGHNIHYIDSTGTLTTRIEDKVAGIIITNTAASAVLTLQTDDSQTLITLKQATDGTSQFYNFSEIPIIFGIKGLKVSTITNCVCTILYSQGVKQD